MINIYIFSNKFSNLLLDKNECGVAETCLNLKSNFLITEHVYYSLHKIPLDYYLLEPERRVNFDKNMNIIFSS